MLWREIIGSPLLEGAPIDIPLHASFSYFFGNTIIIMSNYQTSSQYSCISPRSSDFSKKICAV